MFKKRLLTLALMGTILMLIALPIMTAQAAPVTIVDDQGADDEPGQKDLNSLTVDRTPGGDWDIEITWNWDDIAWSGENTGDAQALFDTDGDGFANYTLAVQCGTPADYTYLTLYSCGDDRTDRCSSQVSIPAQDLDGDGDLEPVGGVGPFKSIGFAAVLGQDPSLWGSQLRVCYNLILP